MSFTRTSMRVHLLLPVVIAGILLHSGPAAAQDIELPRSRVIASYYIGFMLGRGGLDEETSRKAQSGDGASFAFVAGMSFFDEFPLNFSIGQMFLDDQQPFTQYVETCTSYGGQSLGCSTAAQESHITVGQLSLDTGYQHRFHVGSAFTVVPAALAGYMWNPGGLKREIGCDGCATVPVDGVDAAGAFLAPELRFVFLNSQFFALTARYEWFVTGHRDNIALFGLQVFAP